MCGSKSKASVFVPKADPYVAPVAPHGIYGTATPTSAVPVSSTPYAAYSRTYAPSQGISPADAQRLAAMRDALIARINAQRGETF